MEHDENNQSNDEPSYYENAEEIKKNNKRERIYNALIGYILQVALILILSYFLGYYALIGLVIGILFFLPNPLPHAPSEYIINQNGIKIGNKIRNIFEKNYDYKLNKKNNYISISRGLKGEILRLYSSKPEELYEILIRLKTNNILVEQKDKIKENTVDKNIINKDDIKIDLYFLRLKNAVKKHPPLLLLIVSSILALIGLFNKNEELSSISYLLFQMAIVLWGVLYAYRKFSKKNIE